MQGTTPMNQALKPPGWDSIDGLVCGFGSRAVEAPPATRLLVTQVHGRRVVDADDFPLVAGPDIHPRLDVEADALVASREGLLVGVRTADCVPILLVAPAYGWAAAVHAGWRGTINDIAGAAVEAAEAAGVPAASLLAALGPSIGPCCYEVSLELGERFAAAGLSSPPPAAGRPHLDLRAVNRLLLERRGVPAEGIVQWGPCTRCAQDRYHSFRADPESAGRQVSWIGWEDRRPLPDREPPR
jgi:YfiH family protein